MLERRLRGDVSGWFAGPERILFTVPTAGGTAVRELEVGGSGAVTRAECNEQIHHVFPAPEGGFFCMGPGVTPADIPTRTLIRLGFDGELSPVLPADNAFRFGFCFDGASMYYLKSTTWCGAGAGRSWGLPNLLCRYTGGEEVTFMAIDAVMDGYGAQPNQGIVPFCRTVDQQSVVLFDFEDGTVKEVEALQPSSPTVAPDGKTVACLRGRIGPGQRIVEFDIATGEVVADHALPLSRRVVQVLHDPAGELYYIESQAGTGRAELFMLESGGFVWAAELA
jgi:hypothetical protein